MINNKIFNVKKDANSINKDLRTLISTRYKRITKAINTSFWGIESETAHSMYVGSYGRGTAILTSDLDVLMELPIEDYDRFTSANGNGQSRLLQSVRDAILTTYPNTTIRGDGQVVVVLYSDGMKFEILPAFKKSDLYGYGESYIYPDTHMGGNWLSTNPRAEQEAMKIKNDLSNGLLYDTCKQIRYLRDYHFTNYELSGILIDSFVYNNIGGWYFGNGHDSGPESYEMMLYRKYNECSFFGKFPPTIIAPGSNMEINSNKGWDTLGKVLKFMLL